MSTATKKEDTKKDQSKKGDYSELGIHPNDKVTASGHKEKFDRGDPTETKEDIIQQKKPMGKVPQENPTEYTEPGIHSGDEVDASGHKKKADRAAPEENQTAFDKLYPNRHYAEHTEVSKPNYVEEEAIRNKEATKQAVAGLSEKDFLQSLITKAGASGWNSPIVEEMKHRIETLEENK